MSSNGNGHIDPRMIRETVPILNSSPVPERPENYGQGVAAVAFVRRLNAAGQLNLTEAEIVTVQTPAGPRKTWQFHPVPDDLVSAEEFLGLLIEAVRQEIQPLKEEIRVMRNKLGKGGDANISSAYDALPPGMAIVSAERLEALEAWERTQRT